MKPTRNKSLAYISSSNKLSLLIKGLALIVKFLASNCLHLVRIDEGDKTAETIYTSPNWRHLLIAFSLQRQDVLRHRNRVCLIINSLTSQDDAQRPSELQIVSEWVSKTSRHSTMMHGCSSGWSCYMYTTARLIRRSADSTLTLGHKDTSTLSPSPTVDRAETGSRIIPAKGLTLRSICRSAIAAQLVLVHSRRDHQHSSSAPSSNLAYHSRSASQLLSRSALAPLTHQN